MTEREPSIISDFADIRSRMLGDDKPRPRVAEIAAFSLTFADYDTTLGRVVTPIDPIAFLELSDAELDAIFGMKETI